MAKKIQYRRPPARDIHGILLLDKPLGLSSNQALQKVRNLYNATKAGHTGALDPLATGLLPICLGDATKIAGLLLSEAKAYRTRVQLGADTETDDAEGQIVRQRPVPALAREVVEAVLPQFCGRIRQVPPRYSALKREGEQVARGSLDLGLGPGGHARRLRQFLGIGGYSALKREGEPLYLRARRGEVFDVPAREVEVMRIDLLDFGPDWLELDIECGSGTYIRSLARDIGDALGCGGHVAALRRLWVDPFRQPQMHTLDALDGISARGEGALDALLLPVQAGLAHWRRVVLDAAQEKILRHGQRPRVGEAAGAVLAMAQDGTAIGLAEVLGDGTLAARRLFRPSHDGTPAA